MKKLICIILLGLLIAVNAYSQTVDYRRYQSPVRDQTDRGTCTAFAVLAALETFPGFPSDMSEQYLYAMVKSNPEYYNQTLDYQQGAVLHSYIQALVVNGTLREDQEPYNPDAVIWDVNATNFEKMKKDLAGTRLLDLLKIQPFSYTIQPEMYNYRSGKDARDIQWIKSQLDNGVKAIPVGYGINGPYWSHHPATQQQKIDPADFLVITDGNEVYDLGVAKLKFFGDIFEAIENGDLQAVYVDSNYIVNSGHAVTIVGYDETGFLIKNSWGNPWGEAGYGWVNFDYHRLYAMEVMIPLLGKVKVNTYVEEPPAYGSLNSTDFWLKSLPHKHVNPMFNIKTKNISISVVYHGTTQMPRFEKIEYKAYDSGNNHLGTYYGNTHGIFDGIETGYETYILSSDTDSFPSAAKLVATFTTDTGETFTNVYSNIEAVNREYRPR